MYQLKKNRAFGYGVRGSLFTLTPVPFFFAFLNGLTDFPPLWRLSAAALAAVSILLCAFLLPRHFAFSRFFGFSATAFSLMAIIPYLLNDPFAALLVLAAFIFACHTLVDFKPLQTHFIAQHAPESAKAARWSALTSASIVGLTFMVSDHVPHPVCDLVLLGSAFTAQLLFINWGIKTESRLWKVLATGTGICFAVLMGVSYLTGHHSGIAALSFSAAVLILVPRENAQSEKREAWWESLIDQPARLLLFTFLLLCFAGTLLLVIPASTRLGHLPLVDAAFTAVSAVCVTGLIVVDTPQTFTPLGQALILLLIQMGGLGIMSIAAVALHALGRRLSLRQERILTRMTDTDHKDLLKALSRIIWFTLIMESAGAAFLSVLFIVSGDSMGQGVWRGVFTAISAFCNAGFALQNDSLLPYQSNALVLQTVSLLIIFGGMAPATSLIFPRWVSGKRIPAAPRIALITTVAMLIAGTAFILAFEWNGILAGLSLPDKINNAWFQSVTLRTAGFNSVDMAGVAGPTFMVMIWFMFIGGSPGGTAGGVKTTTIGILAMTFWTHINKRSSVVFQNRRIPPTVIYRAITIVASVAVIWVAAVIMLEVTQQISARDIIFESTSAIGTVGLSMGATMVLDEIGKVIIMVAMFAGRIGPMTLFMLLSEDVSPPDTRCPDIKISLT